MTFENHYSALDRALHRVAFLTWPAQIALSSAEDRLFKTHLTGIEVKKPVFITALPRAGTTLLLEMLVALDEFASHCYRDMPFILIPMLWDRFAASFRQSDVPRERAHGDGMLVNVDSPEAFEEVVWKAFWCEHYKADHIVLWGDEDDLDFSDFLLNHIRKIIALHRNGPATPPPRYVSKNNLNIARLAVVRRRFPDAVVVVPFRHPLQHAASLLRQHCNFLEIHHQDRFACDYMAAIGHYDFGDNLRPVNFDGWLASAQSLNPTTLSFWVKYWTATYEHLLRQQVSAGVQFLSYEALGEQPAQSLERLADVIEIQERDAFLKQESRISAAKRHPVDASAMEPTVLYQAEALYAELKKVSLI